MALHPVGPLPASTYWRRRAVVLVGLVVVLLVLRSCAGGGSHPAARTTPTPTPTPVASSPVPTATPSSPRPTATAAAVGACPDAAVRVVVRTDAQQYPVGSSPRFTVTVTNTSASPCRRDLGPDAVEVVVRSGPDRIWSSDDCSPGKGAELLLLKAGASLEQTVTWSGKRSARGCPSPAARPQAKAGTYRVVARVGTVTSAGAVFRLTGG